MTKDHKPADKNAADSKDHKPADKNVNVKKRPMAVIDRNVKCNGRRYVKGEFVSGDDKNYDELNKLGFLTSK